MEAAARDATGDEPDAVESVAKRLNRTLDNVDRIIVRESPMAVASANGGASRADHGLMIALCGLFLMLGLNAALLREVTQQSALIERQNDRIEAMRKDTETKMVRFQDYLNAIYAQAPSLKPKAATQ